MLRLEGAYLMAGEGHSYRLAVSFLEKFQRCHRER